MKKQIVAYLLLLVIGAQFMTHFGYTKVQANPSVVIPKEAIRLRILANSDSEKDQALKRKVRDKVKEQIDTWVADLRSFQEARRVIQSRLPELEQTVAQTLKEEGSNQSFTVEFGKHVKFPTKVYGNFIYPAGEYEAVLVKLGKGEGANWWCVLFPPLCFLDFSSGTAVEKSVKAQEIVQEEQPKEQPKTEAVPKTEKLEVKQVTAKGKKKIERKPFAVKEAQIAKLLEDEPVAPRQSRTIEVKEEKEVKVKLFFVEAFSSLFSK
ncbi:stage II sporulation protein R [Microbacteriaceae bacterium 4G12]